jgi:hypothetical protein
MMGLYLDNGVLTEVMHPISMCGAWKTSYVELYLFIFPLNTKWKFLCSNDRITKWKQPGIWVNLEYSHQEQSTYPCWTVVWGRNKPLLCFSTELSMFICYFVINKPILTNTPAMFLRWLTKKPVLHVLGNA